MNTKTKPKPERDARLYKYHLDHPGTSIAAIGRMYRITREWARVIIKREKGKEVDYENCDS